MSGLDNKQEKTPPSTPPRTVKQLVETIEAKDSKTASHQSGVPASQSFLERLLSVITPKPSRTQPRTEAVIAPSSLDPVPETKRSPEDEKIAEKFKKDVTLFVHTHNEIMTTEKSFIAGIQEFYETLEQTAEYKSLRENSSARTQINNYLAPYKQLVANSTILESLTTQNIVNADSLTTHTNQLMSWLNSRDYEAFKTGTIQNKHFSKYLVKWFGESFLSIPRPPSNQTYQARIISIVQRAPRYVLFLQQLLKFLTQGQDSKQSHHSTDQEIRKKVLDINNQTDAAREIDPTNPVKIKESVIKDLKLFGFSIKDQEECTLEHLFEHVNKILTENVKEKSLDQSDKTWLKVYKELLTPYQSSDYVLTELVASLGNDEKNLREKVNVAKFLTAIKSELITLCNSNYCDEINTCNDVLSLYHFIDKYDFTHLSRATFEGITHLQKKIEEELNREYAKAYASTSVFGIPRLWFNQKALPSLQSWFSSSRVLAIPAPTLSSAQTTPAEGQAHAEFKTDANKNNVDAKPSPKDKQHETRVKCLSPLIKSPHSFHKIYEGLLKIGPGQKNVERNLSSGLPNEFDTENQALLDFVTPYAKKEYCKNPMLAYAAGVAVAGEAKEQKHAPAQNEETPPSLFQQLLRQIPKAADTHDQKGETPNSPDYYAPIRQALNYFNQTEHNRTNGINSAFHSQEVLYSLKNMVLHDINTIFTPPTRTHKTKLNLEAITRRIANAVPDDFKKSNINNHFNDLLYCLNMDIIPLIQTAEPIGNFDKRLFKEYQDRYLPVEQPSKPVQPAVVLPSLENKQNPPQSKEEEERREQLKHAERGQQEQNIAEQKKQKTKSMILFLTERTPNYQAFLARKQKDSLEQSKTEAKNQQSANTTTDRLLTLGLFLLMGVALFIYFNPLNFSFSLSMLTLTGICTIICATLVSYLLWMKPNNPWVKAPASIDSAYNMLDCGNKNIELTNLTKKCNQRLNKQILFSNIDRVKLLLMEDIYPNSLTDYSEKNKESDLALLCWVSHRNKKNKGCNDLSPEEIEKLRAIFHTFNTAIITPPDKKMGRALISGVLMFIFGASLLLSLARLATMLHFSTSLNWLNWLISALNLTSTPLQISSLIFFASTAIAFLCVLWLVRNSDTETKAQIKLFFMPVPALLMFGLGIISSMPMILFAVGVAIPILIYLFNARTFTRLLKQLSKWTLGDAPRLKISLIFFYLFLYSLIPALYSMSMVKTAILWGVACSAALLLAIPYLIEKNLGWARIDTLYEKHGKKITIGLGLILLGLIGGLVTTLVLSPLNMAAIIGLSASICVGGLATIASLFCWKTKSPSLMLKAFFNDLALLWVTITPVLVLFELGVLPWNVLLISSVSLFISIGIKLFRKLKNLRDAGYVEKKQAEAQAEAQAEINEEAEKSSALSTPSFAPANAATRATSLDLVQQEHVSNIKNSHGALKKAAFFGVPDDDTENLIPEGETNSMAGVGVGVGVRAKAEAEAATEAATATATAR